MTMDITVVLGAFAGMLIGFYGIAKVMLNQASKDRHDDRQERLELSKAIQDMAGASGRVADASIKAAAEAEQRNGHLGKQNTHIAKLVAQGNDMTKQLLDQALKTAVIAAEDRDILTHPVNKQKVKKQVVEHQTVNDKEAK